MNALDGFYKWIATTLTSSRSRNDDGLGIRANCAAHNGDSTSPTRNAFAPILTTAMALTTALIFNACGYHSLSYYGEKSFGNGVFVELLPNPEIPESSVAVHDAINKAILTRFNSQIAPQESASGVLKVEILSVERSIIAYSASGFASFYRTTLGLKFSYSGKDGVTFETKSSGFADYSADTTSTVLAEQYRLDSISAAANSALDSFVSKMAFYGAKGIEKAQESNMDSAKESATNNANNNATKATP